MSCTQCGAQLYEGQRFCGNCGARVAAAETARPDPTSDSDPGSADRLAWPSAAPAATSAEMVKKPVVVAAIVALLVIAAGAAAYFTLMRPAGKEELARMDEPPSSSAETADSGDYVAPPKEEYSGAAQEVAPKREVTPKKPAASRSRPSALSAASRPAPARTYETVRDTSVFEKPSASSKVVSSIPRGYTVTVVGSNGNWLEVRSKSGNPPGYIRRSDVLPAIKRG